MKRRYGTEVDLGKGRNAVMRSKGKGRRLTAEEKRLYADPTEPKSKWSEDMPLEKQLVRYTY